MGSDGITPIALLPAMLVYELTPRSWWRSVPEGTGLMAAGVFSGLCWYALVRSIRMDARRRGR